MPNRLSFAIAAVVLAATTLFSGGAYAQSGANSLPNPYQLVEKWAQLPSGRTWGSVSAVHVDAKDHLWAADKCGDRNTCVGRTEDPILEFDSSGKLLKSLGSGLFVAIHGIFVDRDGNIWVTDYRDAEGKGQQVTKLSPDGKVLLRLGKAGVAANGPDTLNEPTDVAVAPNGDIFVSEGHGGPGDARILKFSKDGTFIKTWGKKGSAPGELNIPHALAFDSQGRLFVGDRGNNRIQIFDQDGKLLAEWKQFGRPSGIFIDRNDTIYVADSESNPDRNPGFQRGVRVGSAKDGSVRVFLPIVGPDPKAPTGSTEGVAADSKGTIYGGETGTMDLKAYARK